MREINDAYDSTQTLLAPIGISDVKEEGKWVDKNGKKPNYTNWDVNQPDNSYHGQHFATFRFPCKVTCSVFSIGIEYFGYPWETEILGAWDDVKSERLVNIICVKNPTVGTHTTTRLTSTTTTTKQTTRSKTTTTSTTSSTVEPPTASVSIETTTTEPIKSIMKLVSNINVDMTIPVKPNVFLNPSQMSHFADKIRNALLNPLMLLNFFDENAETSVNVVIKPKQERLILYDSLNAMLGANLVIGIKVTFSPSRRKTYLLKPNRIARAVAKRTKVVVKNFENLVNQKDLRKVRATIEVDSSERLIDTQVQTINSTVPEIKKSGTSLLSLAVGFVVLSIV